MKLSRDELLERFDHDEELLAEITQIFATSSQDNLDLIQAALQTKDAALLTLNAHSLKGAASNFSAELVTLCAGALEAKGKSGDFNQTQELYEQLKKEVEQLISELVAFTAN